jgi:ribonucleoside-diphosphate reductase alpha chain
MITEAKPFFCPEGISPYDTVKWVRRTARIANENGHVFFEQPEVEVPESWSQTATNIVASKYFRGRLGTEDREYSVRQLVARVVDTITRWGRENEYFSTRAEADLFASDLAYLLLHQYASFNSPVWFNVGTSLVTRPQSSACFILSVADTMEDLLDLAKTEGMIFKYGSGAGVNLSRLRGSMEGLSSGGTASGPVSFMKGYDAFAGVIRSGGRTRRAAKMIVLDVDHPDIVDFIGCKAREEKKACTLLDAGYSAGLDGEAYASVYFQNANHSVRVPDDFLRVVEEDAEWTTRARTTGAALHRYRARDLLRQIAEAAWACGDPGLQYDTTINRWHTVKNSGRIHASNPCGEFVFLENSSCNLSSLNLLKFLRADGRFDTAAFARAVEILILAQEILVSNSAYPTPEITRNSHDFRPLGLGYTNLGALLMRLGIPYDSDKGRALAAAITSLMTARAYAMSARIAGQVGAFNAYPQNADAMMDVIERHQAYARVLAGHPDHVSDLEVEEFPLLVDRANPEYFKDPNLVNLFETSLAAWEEAVRLGAAHGYRNAQVSLIAPTGTISFMMDCDTTGIEPELALVKYKNLVGGGVMKLVNQSVPATLARLGYDAEIPEIVRYIEEVGTIEGAPHIRPEDLPIFDCSFKPDNGVRSIAPLGHVRMIAAVQPFLSGAVSKTINLPTEATVEDIEDIYVRSWQLGIKCISIYRNGCKRVQPLVTSPEDHKKRDAAAQAATAVPVRRRLPAERQAIIHKFSIAGNEGYLTVGTFDDGAPAEIFITVAKDGSTLSGLLNAFATVVSVALQYGVPLDVLIGKFEGHRFEPSGFTGHAEIPHAKSIVDYIFRWLELRFLATPKNDPPTENRTETTESNATQEGASPTGIKTLKSTLDGQLCPRCGSLMEPAGACAVCRLCAHSSGGCS